MAHSLSIPLRLSQRNHKEEVSLTTTEYIRSDSGYYKDSGYYDDYTSDYDNYGSYSYSDARFLDSNCGCCLNSDEPLSSFVVKQSDPSSQLYVESSARVFCCDVASAPADDGGFACSSRVRTCYVILFLAVHPI